MSDRIVIPDGMLEAACHQWREQKMEVQCVNEVNAIVRAALLWQRENAPVPTEETVDTFAIQFDKTLGVVGTFARWFAVEWSRRMYDPPETEEPEIPSSPLDSLSDSDLAAEVLRRLNVGQSYRGQAKR